MAYKAINPENYKDKVVGSGQCVAFVQKSASAPSTGLWKEGSKVKGTQIQKGTAIATFQGGKYQNRTNGDSHAAVYIRQDSIGIYVWDQWKGHPVNTRCIRFKGGKGTPNNDGDAFSVID